MHEERNVPLNYFPQKISFKYDLCGIISESSYPLKVHALNYHVKQI